MKQSFKKRYRHFKYLLFVMPAFIVWLVISIYPNIQVYWLSLLKWNGYSGEKVFVGLQNFKRILLFNPYIFKMALNTIYYMLFLYLLQTIFSITLAMILSKNTSFNKFFRVLFFFPNILSSTVVALAWGYIYSPNLGIINIFLDAFGIKGPNWLGVPTLNILCVVIVHMWQGIGVPILIFIAALQAIPATLYESAVIEGAGGSNCFFKITLPLLAPTVIRISFLTILTSIMAFDYIFILGGGQLSTNNMDNLATYLYKSLNDQNIGLPSALGVMISIFMTVVFILQYYGTKKVEKAIY